MATKIGINGFGRIGRLVYRIAREDPEVEVVAINNHSKIETMTHLLKYDSVHGRLGAEVSIDGEVLCVGDQKVQVTHGNSPEEIPWGDLGVDIVIESTGKFNDGTKAIDHIEKGGAKKVLLTAPGKNVDRTIVMGVNDAEYDAENDRVISNASCTTNCLAPFAKVLCDEFGIVRGYMNTIHAYTNDQVTLDRTHKDLRRGRAAGMSIIPTTTGAARAVSLVLPQLAGKLDGFATRVPTPDGSMVDLTVELEREVTADEINAAMKAAAEGALKGILEYTEDPIVSIDIVGNPASSIFDSGLTMVIGGKSNLVKCVSWYDNEWGYSNRVVDLAKIL